MKVIVSFWRLSLRDKILAGEIVGWLGLVHVALRLFPSRRVVRFLTVAQQHRRDPSTLESTAQLHRIGSLITAVSRYLPWACTCLTQALVGKIMLMIRGLPGEVCVGVRHDAATSFTAHAWLRSGTVYVTGGEGVEVYSVLMRPRPPQKAESV